jgi:mRNA-degrading endonuclease RelE of RelBE toxin-antitoxin system
MKPCSVVWTKEAINQLSSIWLRSPDRSSITKCVSTIDEVLSRSPLQKGFALHEGLYFMFMARGCLRVLYAVDEKASRVEVAAVSPKSDVAS